MTRRQFEALAAVLAAERPIRAPFIDEDVYLAKLATWQRIRDAVGDVCSASNGRFDRGRFERACEGQR
jgi:hypothetical protein